MKQKKEKSNANVFRIHKDKNFVVMSNRHLFDKPPLSLKAKGLLCLLLALPDDWNYSINGLTAISRESRDCICSTLKELQNFGYVEIEQTRTKGMFGAVYHIYETPQKKTTESENPNRLNRIGKTESENPTQININNQDINNEKINNILDENASVFGVHEIFNLYKKICSIYPQPRFLTAERIAAVEKRLLKYPDESFWVKVFENVVKSEFCKKSNFISFDWFFKNNTNALKAFEGNYNSNNDSSNAAIDLNKYANYCEKQKAVQNA